MTTTATEAAELVRSGKTSARELTEATLARIEAVNPALNALDEPVVAAVFIVGGGLVEQGLGAARGSGHAAGLGRAE